MLIGGVWGRCQEDQFVGFFIDGIVAVIQNYF